MKIKADGVLARHRRERVPLPVHRGYLLSLRRAVPVPAFRGLAWKAKPLGREESASRGTLECSAPTRPRSPHSDHSFALALAPSLFIARSTSIPALQRHGIAQAG